MNLLTKPNPMKLVSIGEAEKAVRKQTTNLTAIRCFLHLTPIFIMGISFVSVTDHSGM